MKTIWVKADEAGKVTAAVEKEKYAIDMQAVDVDDGFELQSIDDYRLIDGSLSYTGEGTAAREEAEKQAQAEAEERERLDSASREYFLDGGKAQMEQDIRDAAASGGEAKQAADTAVASVNEYMDALLGLNTTDETEATDAE